MAGCVTQDSFLYNRLPVYPHWQIMLLEKGHGPRVITFFSETRTAPTVVNAPSCMSKPT